MNESKPQTNRISAYGLITNANDRVLLCRLSSIVEDSAGKWTLPGGGLDYGEDPSVAVIREIKEETGLTAHLGKLLDVDSTVMEFSTHITHAIRIIYQVNVDPGELKVEKGGSTDACDWFTQDAVKHLPMVTLAQKGMKLLGWTDDSTDQREKCDLSLTGLIQHFEAQGNDARAKMVVDYLQEIHEIHNNHTNNARRRILEIKKYR